MRRRTRLLVVGPYGGANLGDDLILEMILEQLSQLSCEAVVSCADPAFVHGRFGVETTTLLDYRSLALNSLAVLLRADAVLIGGGEQLSEPRLPNPIWGHLARTTHLCWLAHRLGKPSMLWGVGLSELRSAVSRQLVRRAICQHECVATFRDAGSMARAQALAQRPGWTPIRVADPAFLLARRPQTQCRNFLHQELGIEDAGKPLALIVPVNDKYVSLSYVDRLVAWGHRMVADGWRVAGWVTDLQPAYDLKVRNLECWHAIPGFRWVSTKHFRGEEMALIVGGAQLLVSARMHPLIIAQTQGVPCVALTRSVKMESMQRELGIPALAIARVETDALYGLSRQSSQATGARHGPLPPEVRHMQHLAGSTRAVFERRILQGQAHAPAV